MAVSVRSTSVTEPSGGFVVTMTLSSEADVETASDVIEFRVTIASEDQYPRLAELQRVALLHVKGLLDAEIQRLGLAKGRTP